MTKTIAYFTLPKNNEVIYAIVTDSKKIAAEPGNNCRINLDNLNNRIEWERT